MYVTIRREWVGRWSGCVGKTVSSARQILYNDRIVFLYRRLDDRKQHVVHERDFKDMGFDLGDDDKIMAIEILDASRHLNLAKLFL
jgi:uncharacterized protein YuzE